MGKEKNDFGLLFWVHLSVLVVIYSSPFWLSWKWIVVGIAIWYIQILFYGNCFLTNVEFGKSDRGASFHGYYLAKLGIRPNPKKLSFFITYILPWSLFAVAYLRQTLIR